MNIFKLAGKSLNTNSKKQIKKFILKNIYFDRLVATYDSWIVENYPDAIDILEQKNEIQTYTYKPLISITVPTYNTPEKFLRECIGSVLVQSYENWELVLVDDASPDPRVRDIIKEYAAKDERIKYKFLKQNHHIAGATNEAIKLSTGEFVGLFDHDDILWPNALFEVAKALNADKAIEFIYTDEDKIVEEKSRHAEPFFKPDWSPSLLRTCNYITHFSVFKRELLDKVGLEDGAYNGAQDWEMIMRASREAKKIHHVPKVVYSWRVHDNSTAKSMDAKPYVIEAQRNVIADDMRLRGYTDDDFTVAQNNKFFAFWETTLKNSENSKVSIITFNRRQLNSVRKQTAYQNCEYIQAFNLTDAVRQATGDYIVFFEPDIYIRNKNWVEILLNSAAQEGVGMAGGLITYENGGYIYSAGITLNQDNKLVHTLSGGISMTNLKTLTRTIYVHTRRNTTALSGCMMVRSDNLDGYRFDDNETITAQLVTLGADLVERGLYNVYDPAFTAVIEKKYVKKKKYENKERRRTYADNIVEVELDAHKHKAALSRRYFYDDLVSYPDADEL